LFLDRIRDLFCAFSRIFEVWASGFSSPPLYAHDVKPGRVTQEPAAHRRFVGWDRKLRH
jgi:hypothetical protein